MRTISRLSVALLALTLTACAPEAEAPAQAPTPPQAPSPPTTQDVAQAAPGVTLQPTRVTVRQGTASVDLTFGMAEASVVQMLDTLRGKPATRGRNDECGAGPLTFADWGDDLSLAFQDGKLAGWWADDKAPADYRTEAGIAVGATLAELRAAYPDVAITESTIGTEFAAGEVFGILSGNGPDARVTALWAGVSCIFR